MQQLIIYFSERLQVRKDSKITDTGKIQLWALAKLAKEWEGEYPLVFDVASNCYCIHATDCTPIDHEGLPMLGTAKPRPSKKMEPLKKVISEKVAKVESVVDAQAREQVVEDINKKLDEARERRDKKKNVFVNERPAKYISDQYKRKQTTEIYLKNKVLDLTLAGRSEDAQILAKAFRIISMEIE